MCVFLHFSLQILYLQRWIKHGTYNTLVDICEHKKREKKHFKARSMNRLTENLTVNTIQVHKESHSYYIHSRFSVWCVFLLF